MTLLISHNILDCECDFCLILASSVHHDINCIPQANKTYDVKYSAYKYVFPPL